MALLSFAALAPTMCAGPQSGGGGQSISRRTLLQWLASSSGTAVLPGVPAADAAGYLSGFQVPKDLDDFASRVKSFTLDNGAKFVVLERGVSPTVSFVTYVDVGASDEEDGKTGIAHFLEHLAFKGTRTIGTRGYQQEAPILQELDALTEKRRELQAQGTRASEAQLKTVNQEIDRVQAAAEELVVPNEFARVVQQQGGVGLNAATSIDSTQYFYSFPSNKTELWFAMESERFREPVFRQFEKEKLVVLEERKLRVDNDSIGKFLEELLLKAFDKHPYRRPVIGFQEDVAGALDAAATNAERGLGTEAPTSATALCGWAALSRQDVEGFFENFYAPENITFGIVGDVELSEVRRLAETYFGKMEGRPSVRRAPPVESKQTEEKELVMSLNAEPWYLEAYRVPELDTPLTPAIRLLEGVLSGGRTSRLYRSLVVNKQVALQASFSSGFPGDKYPSLGLLFALPAPGVSIDTLASALREEIDRIKEDGVITDEELERVKRRQKVAFFNSFQSNSLMAGYLCEYAAKTGDARNAFRVLAAMENVKAREVTEAARTIFRADGRTVGKLI